MKVAALYDVHANVPALEAVLAEVEHEGVETILFGGDLTWGPEPRETLAIVRSLAGTRFVRGNCDREPDEWERASLSGEEVEFLQGLPERQELDGILYCHATPRSDEEIVTPATPDEDLAGIVAGVEQHAVVVGHTHMQQDRRIGSVRWVNAGSVGMAYEGELVACWALADDGEIELRRTPLDVERVAEAFRRSGWPRAEEFLNENVLESISREQATAELEAQR
ncbi:MAG TPA: metallophosphoesterase family protein [Gaiellaceae bacterium]|nr:metallophosphoesterase family protein [Gaiellaceae bacterium]